MNSEGVSVIIPTHNRVEDVMRCLGSVLNSSYQNIEVIVVDNASLDRTVARVKEVFGKDNRVKLIECKSNLYAAGGRNLGAKHASGKYLLFVDSDNVVDKKMIGYLVDFYKNHSDCGMVGPLMLYSAHPTRIWMHCANISLYSGRAVYKGNGEKDIHQYDDEVIVGHLPNCFMVRRDDFEQLHGFDEKYLIMFEEADLAERIKKSGKKIYLYSRAITYHNVPLIEEKGFSLGLRSPERAYLTARNRIYFLRKNAGFGHLIIFALVFSPLLMGYYEVGLLIRGQVKKALYYLFGTFAGLIMRKT